MCLSARLQLRLPAEDHEAGRGDYDMRLQDLGTIKLVLRLAKSSGPGFAGEPDDCKEFELSSVSSRPVSERSLKGVDVSNTVKYVARKGKSMEILIVTKVSSEGSWSLPRLSSDHRS